MSRVGVVTQARMTSTRLPGKVLLTAAGRSFLDHHLDRLLAAGLDVYVATTSNEADDPIVERAHDRGLSVHRGSEDDVLSRFTGTIEEFSLDTVVRVTSDCPLIDGALVARAVESFLAEDDPWLYLSNGLTRTWPRGMDLEVFSAQALLDADAAATDPVHREHVTPYLYTNGSGRMTLRNLARPEDASAYRLTLDTRDDQRLLTTLLEEYDAARLDADALVALLDAHPELAAINAHVEQKKLGE